MIGRDRRKTTFVFNVGEFENKKEKYRFRDHFTSKKMNNFRRSRYLMGIKEKEDLFFECVEFVKKDHAKDSERRRINDDFRAINKNESDIRT